MPITVVCYSCGQQLEAADDADGKFAPCPKCGTRLEVRRAKEASAVKTGSSEPLRLPCPHCKATVSIPRDLINQVVECAHCDRRFKVETASPKQQREPQHPSEQQPSSSFHDVVIDTTKSRTQQRARAWRRIPAGTIVGAALGLMFSYWWQPGMYKAFCPFSSYLFDCPRLMLHLVDFGSPSEPGDWWQGPVARTMVLLTSIGGLIGFALSRFVPALRRTINDEDVSAVARFAHQYAGQYRRRKVVRNALPLLLTIILACVALGLAFVLLNNFAPTAMRKVTSITKPAWHRSILDYLEKHERLLSVDRVYKPESLDGAVVRVDRGVWFDARGEDASALMFGPEGPGKGECNSTCKFGVRVEYQVDEGFGRTGREDRVFFLTGDNKVTGDIPIDRIQFGGVRANDESLKEAEDFLSGKTRNAL